MKNLFLTFLVSLSSLSFAATNDLEYTYCSAMDGYSAYYFFLGDDEKAVFRQTVKFQGQVKRLELIEGSFRYFAQGDNLIITGNVDSFAGGGFVKISHNLGNNSTVVEAEGDDNFVDVMSVFASRQSDFRCGQTGHISQ